MQKLLFSLVKMSQDSTKEVLNFFLGVLEIKEYEKYLGFPTIVGRNKKPSLNYIEDKVWGKL